MNGTFVSIELESSSVWKHGFYDACCSFALQRPAAGRATVFDFGRTFMGDSKVTSLAYTIIDFATSLGTTAVLIRNGQLGRICLRPV
jgi:hypothetical protein